MGVPNIWLIDTAAETANACVNGNLEPTVHNELLTAEDKIKLQLKPLLEGIERLAA